MKGLTLIEILLATFIFVLVFLLIIFLTFNIDNVNTYFIFNLGKQKELMTTAKIISKELRSMAQSNLGNYPLEDINNDQIIFYSDLDNDQLVEKIKYFTENNNLKKSIIKPQGNPLNYSSQNEVVYTLITDLTNNHLFDYYDQNNQLTNNIEKVKLIKVNLEAREKNQRIVKYSFIVAPRNLRFK